MLVSSYTPVAYVGRTIQHVCVTKHDQTKHERFLHILDHPFLCGLFQLSAGVQLCYGDKNMLRH